jgi:hypothetical protein
MANATHIAQVLIEEGVKARAHFQVWWALRNCALPKYYKAMNDLAYVDYFHASNSGHYTLFLLSLAKLFDRDPRVAGMRELKRALRSEGRTSSALAIGRTLKPHEATIKSVMAIRNRTVVHNEHSIARHNVYEINGVTPNELKALIDAAGNAINSVAADLGITNRVFDSDRTEQATLNMLETLARGARSPQQ